jgi:hypothetical protein
MDITSYVENLKKAKEQFDKDENKEEELDKDIKSISGKLTNYKFNPQDNNIVDIYNIMDVIAELQIEFSKIMVKGIRYEMASELLQKSCESVFNDLHSDLLLSDEVKSPILKTVGDREAYIQIQVKNIQKYVTYAEKQKIKSKKILQQISTLIGVIVEIDDKVSRKVSVLQIQKDIGALKFNDTLKMRDIK